jgi:hypothetical protein
MSETPDSTWTLQALRGFAAEHGIELTGLRRKEDVLARVSGDPDSLVAATERSIEDAVRLGVLDRRLNAGPIEAILALARKIDVTDAYMQALAQDAERHGTRPPSPDNVSLSAYLKFSEKLCLLPGRPVGEQRAPGSRPKTPRAEQVAPPAEAAPEATPDPQSAPTALPQGADRAAKLSKLRGAHAG